MTTTLFDALPPRRPLQLSGLALPAPLSIVVLAPHPDDFDAIAVTLHCLHRQGHAIHLAVLTTGANGIDDGWNGLHDADAKAAAREAEQRASCEFFGLPDPRVSFLRLWEQNVADRYGRSQPGAGQSGGEEGDLGAQGMAVRDLERLRAYLHEMRPDMVFLPHGNDSNRTHRRTYESFRDIALRDRLAVLACLNLDAKTIDMRFDLLTPFGEQEAAWKAELLRFHRSQQERNLVSRGHGFDERVLQVNRAAAEKAGLAMPYAEAFELQRFG